MVATERGVIPIHSAWLGEMPTVAREKYAMEVLHADAKDRDLLDGVESLTTHQRNILRCRSYGMCNREIGVKFGISEQTVKNTLTSVWIKLDLPKDMESKSARACYLLGMYDAIAERGHELDTDQ